MVFYSQIRFPPEYQDGFTAFTPSIATTPCPHTSVTAPLSRPVEHCEGCPALAGVRKLGLDDPSPDRPVLHCNFGGALGVVFGDIGTSPTTIQTAFNRNHPLPVPISTDNVYGLVSLIFWSMMIIVTLTLVMRAGNDGGGSIMALITLLRRYGGARGRRTAMTLAALDLFGATVFFGESMITPAISPGSDRDSLNRAVRAVLADVGSVLIIDERVADAFAAPGERYHYAWAAGRDVAGRHHHSTRSARWRTMGAGGDVLGARGDTRSRPRARHRWKAKP